MERVDNELNYARRKRTGTEQARFLSTDFRKSVDKKRARPVPVPFFLLKAAVK